jgi:hypothetical protein
LVEAAVGKLSGIDQVKLEVSNVFRSRKVQRFLNKVLKAIDMEGVGIDCSVSEVADSHIFCEPLGEPTGTFWVWSHGRC